MKETPRTSSGNKIAAKWDGMDFMERLKLIMNFADKFLEYGLIARSELALVTGMPESDWEYIVGREDQPLFTSIHLKKEVAAQLHREKLKAALWAVFK
ncbi:hypothetical protein JXD20_00020 [Candidatus Peregrinibacteria bacterium]|nr:hypothetical protein [Candidatus Peregrinibacteria bacterium]